MWEKTVPIDEVREIRCKTSVVFGAGAIEKTYDVLKTIQNYINRLKLT
jgi:hypothetical protein